MNKGLFCSVCRHHVRWVVDGVCRKDFCGCTHVKKGMRQAFLAEFIYGAE